MGKFNGVFFFIDLETYEIYTWQTQRSLRGNFHATGLWTSE